MAEADGTWAPGWRERLFNTLRANGYANLGQYLEDHPGVPYTTIAERLGGFAAFQLHWIQNEEVIDHNSTRRVAMDALVRELNDLLSSGWPSDSSSFELAHTYGCWASRMYAFGSEVYRRAKPIWDELKSRAPSEGWLPKGPDDPIIVQSFATVWPPE